MKNVHVELTIDPKAVSSGFKYPARASDKGRATLTLNEFVGGGGSVVLHGWTVASLSDLIEAATDLRAAISKATGEPIPVYEE